MLELLATVLITATVVLALEAAVLLFWLKRLGKRFRRRGARIEGQSSAWPRQDSTADVSGGPLRSRREMFALGAGAAAAATIAVTPKPAGAQLFGGGGGFGLGDLLGGVGDVLGDALGDALGIAVPTIFQELINEVVGFLTSAGEDSLISTSTIATALALSWPDTAELVAQAQRVAATDFAARTRRRADQSQRIVARCAERQAEIEAQEMAIVTTAQGLGPLALLQAMLMLKYLGNQKLGLANVQFAAQTQANTDLTMTNKHWPALQDQVAEGFFAGIRGSSTLGANQVPGR